MRRLAARRRALSASESFSYGVYATSPRRRALVIRRSATRRSSLAFASVVSMRSLRTRFAVRFRNIARRLRGVSVELTTCILVSHGALLPFNDFELSL